MRLNLFGRAFAALLAGLAGVCRWPTPSTAAGTWIRSGVMPSIATARPALQPPSAVRGSPATV